VSARRNPRIDHIQSEPLSTTITRRGGLFTRNKLDKNNELVEAVILIPHIPIHCWSRGARQKGHVNSSTCPTPRTRNLEKLLTMSILTMPFIRCGAPHNRMYAILLTPISSARILVHSSSHHQQDLISCLSFFLLGFDAWFTLRLIKNECICHFCRHAAEISPKISHDLIVSSHPVPQFSWLILGL
jgi:hypothetical protein